MVKNHSDMEKRNLLLPFLGLLFSVVAKNILYVPIHGQDSTYMAFVTQVAEHWLKWEIGQVIHQVGLMHWPTSCS